MSYKPCKYCINDRQCNKQLSLKTALKGYFCRNISFICEAYEEQYYAGEKVMVINRFFTALDGIKTFENPREATVLCTAQRKKNYVIVELDEEYNGIKEWVVKRKQLQKITEGDK